MSGRTGIVTGGGSGIGEAISHRLAADGLKVAVLDLNGEHAAAVASAITDAGGTAIGITVDVTDRTGVEDAVTSVVTHLGKPTVLVNNAGISGHSPFLELTQERWDQIHAVNLTGAFHACQVVIPYMVESGWGRVVNISSSSVHSGAPRLAAYVSAKSAMVGLTKALALEFAGNGITVNTVPPGFINTPMSRASAARGAVNFEEQIGRTPVGRQGTPEDIAAVTSFLVRDEASYITGQVIGVNGGRNT